uniref:Uncharacterized protein n=1 Tax=Globodera rostochiensis TaxID=31243 RepID=A0A914HX90_GLORO
MTDDWCFLPALRIWNLRNGTAPSGRNDLGVPTKRISCPGVILEDGFATWDALGGFSALFTKAVYLIRLIDQCGCVTGEGMGKVQEKGCLRSSMVRAAHGKGRCGFESHRGLIFCTSAAHRITTFITWRSWVDGRIGIR